MSDEALESIKAAIDGLTTASDAAFEAGDLLSDLRADRWADQGGVGRPPADRRIDALYRLSKKAEALLEEALGIYEEVLP